jgi:hypothetical protein
LSSVPGGKEGRNEPLEAVARPYSAFFDPTPRDSTVNGVVVEDSRALSIPPFISEEKCSFSTRSFLLRYCGEVVELNEAGLFTLEVDWDGMRGEPRQRRIVLEVDLLWAETHADRVGPGASKEEDSGVQWSVASEFEVVASQSFVLNGIAPGIHEFVPVTFNARHFCRAGLCVHTALSGIRFDPMPLKMPADFPDSTQDVTASSGASSVASKGAATFVEHLFPKPRRVFGAGTPGARETYAMADPLIAGRADRLYSVLVPPLVAAFDQVAQQLHDVRTVSDQGRGSRGRCTDASEPTKLNEGATAPPLRLLHMPLSDEADRTAGRPESFSRRLATLSRNAVAEGIAQELEGVGAQVGIVWYRLLALLPKQWRGISALLERRWRARLLDWFGRNVHQECLPAFRLRTPDGDRRGPLRGGVLTADAAGRSRPPRVGSGRAASRSVGADDRPRETAAEVAATVGQARRNRLRANEQRAERACTGRAEPLEKLPVQDAALLLKPSDYPIIFQQTFSRGSPENGPKADNGLTRTPSLRPGDGHKDDEGIEPLEGTAPERLRERSLYGGRIDLRAARAAGQRPAHIIVLLHGFRGSSGDLRLIRNWLSVILGPKSAAVFLLSRANEGPASESSLDLLGERLAREVTDFVLRLQRRRPVAALSFVGHSLGGVVVRQALRHELMRPLAGRLHTLMTFSSPHLGYRYGDAVVCAGMRAMNAWKRSPALEQLRLCDEPALEDTFLFRLAAADPPVLALFQRALILCSSHQDKYCPFGSARAELCAAARADTSDSGQQYHQMAFNALRGVPPERVIRFDVDYQLDISIDAALGRAAHMNALSSVHCLIPLLHLCREYFVLDGEDG